MPTAGVRVRGVLSGGGTSPRGAGVPLARQGVLPPGAPMTVNGAPYLVENLPGLWVTVDNGGETPLPSANDGGAAATAQSRRRSRSDNGKRVPWSGFPLASLRPTSRSAHTANDLTAMALRVRGAWGDALVDLKVDHCG